MNAAFEEALTKLPKMPRLWLMYTSVLAKQHLVQKTRQVYNWSFRNLPLTQHEKIWSKFTAWAMSLENTSTAIAIIPRYLKLNPDFKQNFASFLISRGLNDRGATVLYDIVNDDGYHSSAGKDRKTFYFELIDLISKNPDKITTVDGFTFIKNGLKEYP